MKKDKPAMNGKQTGIPQRVKALLDAMSLDEKVGQLVLENAFAPINWHEVLQKQKLADERGEPFTIPLEPNQSTVEKIRAGQVSMINSADLALNNMLQRVAVKESRLGIPLLIGHDVIHGFRTIFPIPLAEASTWNPELLQNASRAAAVEAATMGINVIFAPMVDICRDPRWGRIAEGAGEDPFLGSKLAQARVNGFQSPDLPAGRMISACPKHFVGYGAAEAGRDYNTVDISERTLRDVYLPPFKAAFDAGAGCTMSAFNEIAGIPGTSNQFLLRNVLREEWNWDGVVISDFNAIGELVQHGVAEDLRDAARLSIMAGVDLDLESGAYSKHLAGLVNDNLVPLALVDAAVSRVLTLKFKLGLFDHPYVDEGLSSGLILGREFRSLALEVAQQSLVLLKNDKNILPLPKTGPKLALIGPLANNRADLLGTWAITGQSADVETVLQGFSSYLPASEIEYVQGCQVSGDQNLDIENAVEAAARADVVILAVGESASMSGEAHSRIHLGLPGRQQELVNALAATGKPLITLLMCGRPMVVPELLEKSSAFLVTWHGGIRAGQAIADVVFGDVSPSGKLTASWPRAEGQIPVYYAHKSTGRPAEGSGTTQYHEPFRSTYLDEPNAPLFSFGEGLSYTTFGYSGFKILTPQVDPAGELKVRIHIKNTGERRGAEIVQLYVRDWVGSVTRPVKELKGFQRMELDPGEERAVEFSIPAIDLGFHGLNCEHILEPGRFEAWIGPDSVNGLHGSFVIP